MRCEQLTKNNNNNNRHTNTHHTHTHNIYTQNKIPKLNEMEWNVWPGKKESKKKRNNNNNKNEEKNVEINVDIYPTKNIDSGVDSDDDDDGKRASDKIKMMNKKKRWQKNDNDKNKNQFINRVTNQNSMFEKIYKEFIPFESNSSKHKQTNKKKQFTFNSCHRLVVFFL